MTCVYCTFEAYVRFLKGFLSLSLSLSLVRRSTKSLLSGWPWGYEAEEHHRHKGGILWKRFPRGASREEQADRGLGMASKIECSSIQISKYCSIWYVYPLLLAKPNLILQCKSIPLLIANPELLLLLLVVLSMCYCQNTAVVPHWWCFLAYLFAPHPSFFMAKMSWRFLPNLVPWESKHLRAKKKEIESLIII